MIIRSGMLLKINIGQLITSSIARGKSDIIISVKVSTKNLKKSFKSCLLRESLPMQNNLCNKVLCKFKDKGRWQDHSWANCNHLKLMLVTVDLKTKYKIIIKVRH